MIPFLQTTVQMGTHILFAVLGGILCEKAGNISPQLLDMIPYIATILVLILITLRKKKEYQAPAGLGNPYFREER